MHNYYKKNYSISDVGAVLKNETCKVVEQELKNGATYQRSWVESIFTKDSSTLERTALLTASTENVDRMGDVVLLDNLDLSDFRKNNVVLWNHNSDLPPIGKSLWEDRIDHKLKSLVKFANRHPDNTGEFLPDTVHQLALDEFIKGVSIGFLNQESDRPTKEEVDLHPEWKSARRMIRKSKLIEISIVPIGMNQNALIEQVNKGLISEDMAAMFDFAPEPDFEEDWLFKSCDFEIYPEIKAVIAYKATPVANESWDAGEARKRLKDWSDGNMRKYAQGFTTCEGEEENYTSYKLPHHDIKSGKLVVIPAAVSAAIGALNGSRGGLKVSEEDRKGAYNHLKKHYKACYPDKDVPELRSYQDYEKSLILNDLASSLKLK